MPSKKTESSKPSFATVQDLINELNKVPDKSVPVFVWLNSTDPESVYSPGARLAITNVDMIINSSTISGLERTDNVYVDLCAQPRHR